MLMTLAWGVFTIVIITLIWGTSFVVTKGNLDSIPITLLAALRPTLALASLLWVKPERRSLVPGLWLGLLASTGFICLIMALTSTLASKAAFILSLQALVAPLISAWFFKRIVPRRAYAATSRSSA
jgi:drug/metabolite transporter (DMT)-like permease